jgi:hypothetical protein
MHNGPHAFKFNLSAVARRFLVNSNLLGFPSCYLLGATKHSKCRTCHWGRLLPLTSSLHQYSQGNYDRYELAASVLPLMIRQSFLLTLTTELLFDMLNVAVALRPQQYSNCLYFVSCGARTSCSDASSKRIFMQGSDSCTLRDLSAFFARWL